MASSSTLKDLYLKGGGIVKNRGATQSAAAAAVRLSPQIALLVALEAAVKAALKRLAMQKLHGHVSSRLAAPSHCQLDIIFTLETNKIGASLSQFALPAALQETAFSLIATRAK
jgi:hypothetical protein